MNKSTTIGPVAIWIFIGVAMLTIQVMLGGITRLTGSGLSITEWNIITGALPPFSEKEWLIEFDKYRQTPQFRILNIEFLLADFKYIFFWEWLHRFWARLIGIVFIAGFSWFMLSKQLSKDMQKPLLILFLLGALQGAVGWIMVVSGLTGDAVYVKPTRLALHFVFALALIAYAFWFLLQLVVQNNQRLHYPELRRFVVCLLILLGIQLIFGALMAGHKAATAAPTWPDINGSFIPPDILRDKPALINFIENKSTIHFVHRTLAYVLMLATLVFTIRLYRLPTISPLLAKIRMIPMALVVAQVILGILALMVSPQIIPNKWGAFEWFAQLHQITAMLLALGFVALLYLFPRKSLSAKS